MVKRITGLLLVSVLFLTSCYIDMPHDSRYDGLNPFGKGAISIYVKDKSGNPQENVLIKINDTLEFYTNIDGIFSIGTFDKGTLSLSIEKAGYRVFKKDTFISTGELLDFEVVLNYIPVIEELKAYSTVRTVKSFTDTLDYDVNYFSILDERDGIEDIDSCIMTIDSQRFKMFLVESEENVRCTLNFAEDNEFFRIYDLQGEDCFIEVYDKSGEIVKSNAASLVRFVETVPKIISPEEGGALILPDSVIWSSQSVLFESYFKIEMCDAGGLVLSYDSIQSSKTGVYINTLLNEGAYSLYLRLYDLFGNYSENSVTFSIF
ncbi:MAG: carboxypeptidase-like regulatory domain-containing protein [bacterium]